MATEKTAFDDWLKDKLHRDLVFRGMVWIAVPAIASYYAIRFESVDPLQLMMRTTETVMRILNILGSFALFLTCAALMFKDLESCDNANWGQNTRKGYVGGVVRRLAGDLTLWSLGAVLTILTVTGVAISLTNTPISILLGAFVIVLLMWLTVISLMNVLVRRSEPTPVALKLKRPHFVALAYISALVLFPLVVWGR